MDSCKGRQPVGRKQGHYVGAKFREYYFREISKSNDLFGF